MYKVITFCFLIFLVFIPTRSSFSVATSEELVILYGGARSGELEPCGCHANQTGGLQYEAAIYRQAGNEGGVRLDAGGWVGDAAFMKPYAAMKTRFLLHGLARLGFDALNFGAAETSLSRFYYDRLRAECPEAMAPLISANVYLTTSPTALAFPDSRLLTRTLPGKHAVRVAVTGVATLPPGSAGAPPLGTPSDFLIQPPLNALAPVAARLRPQADLLVVLVAGSARDCAALARALPQVDLFIASAPESATNKEPLPPDLARRIVATHAPKGREVGRLRLTLDGAGKWAAAGAPEFIPVSSKLPSDPALTRLLDDYKQATRQFDVPPPLNAEMPYVGMATCAQCHPAEHRDWRASRHARALDTLSERNQQFNPECLPCHTLAYRQANGFYSAARPQSVGMGGVQCECCHGPARRHAQTQRRLDNNPLKRVNPQAYQALARQARQALPRRDAPAALCQKCHEPEHDDHFDYARKVARINHQGAGGGAPHLAENSAAPAPGSWKN